MRVPATPRLFASQRWFMALFLIPAILWALVAYLSMGVYEAQKNALKVIATVEGIETKSKVSRRDKLGHPIEYQDRQQIKISFELDGQLRHGKLLDSNFDLESSWLQYADFDRVENPVGSQFEIFVRRDLAYAAANASVMDRYYLPILIAVFAFFTSLAIGVAALLLRPQK